jgi:hypothetical protein
MRVDLPLGGPNNHNRPQINKGALNMKHSRFGGILLSAVFLVSFSAHSYATSDDIAWTGANGYTMTGMFQYADNLTGTINETQIDTLSIEGFQDGASVGSWDLTAGQSFNFNFDTSNGTFLTGGRSGSTTGQRWNVPNNGSFGFFSGNSSQGLYINGALEPASTITIGSTVTTTGLVPSTLRAIPNPEPSTILLFGTGLGGLLAYRIRKQRMSTTIA